MFLHIFQFVVAHYLLILLTYTLLKCLHMYLWHFVASANSLCVQFLQMWHKQSRCAAATSRGSNVHFILIFTGHSHALIYVHTLACTPTCIFIFSAAVVNMQLCHSNNNSLTYSFIDGFADDDLFGVWSFYLQLVGGIFCGSPYVKNANVKLLLL